MSARFEATGDYYTAIEDAILETPRGRWFLREHAARSRVIESDRVMAALASLEARLGPDGAHGPIEILRRELQDMSHSIVQTRLEIAAIKPSDPSNNRIMAATEELDAIVLATERATSDILSAAERLAEVGEILRTQGAEGKTCDEITTLATNILMACSFQDITGQRTTKVVNVLRYLEQRVNAMIDIWGIDTGIAKETLPGDTRPDAHLLSGPAREGEGVNQDDVDRLLRADARDGKAPAPKPAPLEKVNGHDLDRGVPVEDAEAPIDQDAIDRLFG